MTMDLLLANATYDGCPMPVTLEQFSHIVKSLLVRKFSCEDCSAIFKVRVAYRNQRCFPRIIDGLTDEKSSHKHTLYFELFALRPEDLTFPTIVAAIELGAREVGCDQYTIDFELVEG